MFVGGDFQNIGGSNEPGVSKLGGVSGADTAAALTASEAEWAKLLETME